MQISDINNTLTKALNLNEVNFSANSPRKQIKVRTCKNGRILAQKNCPRPKGKSFIDQISEVESEISEDSDHKWMTIAKMKS